MKIIANVAGFITSPIVIIIIAIIAPFEKMRGETYKEYFSDVLKFSVILLTFKTYEYLYNS